MTTACAVESVRLDISLFFLLLHCSSLCRWKMVLCFLFFIIEQATGQKVKVIQADFTRNSVYKNIEKDLEGLEIGVLGELLVSGI